MKNITYEIKFSGRGKKRGNKTTDMQACLPSHWRYWQHVPSSRVWLLCSEARLMSNLAATDSAYTTNVHHYLHHKPHPPHAYLLVGVSQRYLTHHCKPVMAYLPKRPRHVTPPLTQPFKPLLQTRCSSTHTLHSDSFLPMYRVGHPGYCLLILSNMYIYITKVPQKYVV